jgi:hypothetical protein
LLGWGVGGSGYAVAIGGNVILVDATLFEDLFGCEPFGTIEVSEENEAFLMAGAENENKDEKGILFHRSSFSVGVRG